MSRTDAHSPGPRWYVVALLCSLYVLSYLDRLIVSLLIDDIRGDMHISDVQISLLIGFAFAIFFGFVALPAARIADNGNRRNLIVAGVLIWSCMTAASAFASTFSTLIVCRIGVAIGEAVLVPAGLSIISDLFAREERSRPTGLFLSAGMLGATGAFVVGAAAIDLITASPPWLQPVLAIFRPWQLTFLVVGLPGILLGLIFACTVKEPPRSVTSSGQNPMSLREVVSYLFAQRRLYGCLFFGVALLMPVNFGIVAWFPTFLVRAFGWTPSEAGYALGSMGMLTSVGGTLLLPWCADVLSKRGVQDALVRVALFACLVGGALMIVALNLSQPRFMISLMVPALTLIGGLAALPSIAVQLISPNRMRGQLVALYGLTVALVGLGAGPTLVAVLSTWLYSGKMAIGLAIATLTAALVPISAGLLWRCRKPFGQLSSCSEVGTQLA